MWNQSLTEILNLFNESMACLCSSSLITRLCFTSINCRWDSSVLVCKSSADSSASRNFCSSTPFELWSSKHCCWSDSTWRDFAVRCSEEWRWSFSSSCILVLPSSTSSKRGTIRFAKSSIASSSLAYTHKRKGYLRKGTRTNYIVI